MFWYGKDTADRDIWTKYSNAINFKRHYDFFMDIKNSSSLEDRFKLSGFSLNFYNVNAGNRRYASLSSPRTGAKIH